jgi:hypothetical protein
MSGLREGQSFKSRKEMVSHIQLAYHNINREMRPIRNCDDGVVMLCAPQCKLKREYYLLRRSLKENPEALRNLSEPTAVCEGKVIGKPAETWKGKPPGFEMPFFITQIISHTCNEKTLKHITLEQSQNKKRKRFRLPTKVAAERLLPFFVNNINPDIKAIRSTYCAVFNTDSVQNEQTESKSAYDGSYQYLYRIKQDMLKMQIGDTDTQYARMISILEQMKAFDPDTTIRVKLFPDFIVCTEKVNGKKVSNAQFVF